MALFWVLAIELPSEVRVGCYAGQPLIIANDSSSRYHTFLLFVDWALQARSPASMDSSAAPDLTAQASGKKNMVDKSGTCLNQRAATTGISGVSLEPTRLELRQPWTPTTTEQATYFNPLVPETSAITLTLLGARSRAGNPGLITLGHLASICVRFWGTILNKTRV